MTDMFPILVSVPTTAWLAFSIAMVTEYCAWPIMDSMLVPDMAFRMKSMNFTTMLPVNLNVDKTALSKSEREASLMHHTASDVPWKMFRLGNVGKCMCT